MTTPRRVCFQFQKGRCSFGAKCKFSHEQHDASRKDPKPSSRSTPRQPEPGSDLLRSWRRLLGPDDIVTALSPVKLETFVKDALKILDTGAPGTKQDLVRDLGGEKGLRRIVQILEADISISTPYLSQGTMFDPHVLNFLKVITHEELQSSLILEQTVGTIYNVVYGPNGQRAIKFFTSLSRLFLLTEIPTRDEALSAITAALLNTLSLNQGATVQQEFKDILKVFSTCCDRESESTDIRSARANVSRIKVRLNMGDAISHVQYANAKNNTKPFRPFQLEVDFPGPLSNQGRRHDNDHENIDQISILPTSEEIMSNRMEFLPLKGETSPHHLTGVRRLLDSQFRLLREDTTGQLRDAVRSVIDNWEKLVERSNNPKSRFHTQSQTQTRIYHDVNFESLCYDRRKGLSIDFSFAQPTKVSQMTSNKRREWWEESKDLREGSLLALVDDLHQTTFLLVLRRTVRERVQRSNGTQEEDDSIIRDLASNDKRALVSVCLVDTVSTADQRRLVSLAQSRGSRKLVLVEFPGMLFVAFEPVLKCLQTLYSKPVLPFENWLTPQAETDNAAYARGQGFVNVPAPTYLTRRRHHPLNLKSITKDDRNLFWSVENPVSTVELQARTSLDHGQCLALSSALKNELALIQGPPGTGKSYVGLQLAKVLLSNRDSTGIGPIICVCYTNHALDQFLVELLENKCEKVVRLGSRSKDPRLQDLTIQNLKLEQDRTKQERYQIHLCMSELEEIASEIDDICRQLVNVKHWKALKNYLESHYPAQHAALFRTTDEEGFQFQQRASTLHEKAINKWVNGYGSGFRRTSGETLITRPIEVLLTDNVWNLTTLERTRLKNRWETEMETNLRQELQDALQRHRQNTYSLNRVYKEADRRCLEQAHVIGATTTGFAMNSEVLRSIKAKVLIVEEAAEVLSSHILTALPPSIEHTILIGDHQQLRPQIASYHLSMESDGGKRYALDESLFERLANERFEGGKKFPIAKLDTQRRMHPSMSSLVRETLYPQLRDHKNTTKHPEVPGMKRRLFWLDHDKLEDSAAQENDTMQTSKTNEWEADMVVSFVRHLARQGVYGKGDIAVITPYLGQLRKLRQKLKSSFDLVIGDRDQDELDKDEEDSDIIEMPRPPVKEVQKGSLLDGLRVATVDNFQGEEAKVVIVSLVRSNPKRNCGFLKTSNRINVLLSRAQHGMYIIGNTDTSSRVKMWSDVIGILKANENLGPQVQLQCSRHPAKKIFVSEPDHFPQFSPEGGCEERCGLRLGCGHTCVMKCHSEPLHNVVYCYEDCIRQYECGHSCPKRCGAPCGRCELPIKDVQLLCGHIARAVQCWQMKDLSKIQCQHPVTKALPCGHEEVLWCHLDPETYNCRKSCAVPLPCGHNCRKGCWQCKRKDSDGEWKINHGVCTSKCGRNYSTCNHTCNRICHADEPCLPCDQPCEVRCTHSKCSKICSEPCPPCAEQCTGGCIHEGNCTMPCAVPCDVVPCSKRCDKELACGHRCPGVCGEKCPEQVFCQTCGSPEILNRLVDFVMFETYSNIDLDEDPIIFLSCNHFYTVSSLDGTLHMNEMYEVDTNGIIAAPKATPRISTGEPRKGCPECRAPLRDVHRYNRIIKRSLLDEATRKFVAHSNVTFLALVREVDEFEQNIDARRSGFIARRNPNDLFNHRRPGETLLKKILGFLESVARTEQPFGKVNALVVDAKRRRNVTSLFEFDETLIQTGVGIRGHSIYLRVKWTQLWDLYTISSSSMVDETLRNRITKDYLTKPYKALKERCTKLLANSEKAKLPQQQVEARVYHAQFVGLELRIPAIRENLGDEARTALLNSEQESLQLCERICEEFESCAHLKAEVQQAKLLLRGGTFYQAVDNEERRAVYAAMAQEFQGTGHWYYCENNHPFTVGECGMPMERARCPECGGPVGGQHHAPDAGVRRADDLEAQFGRLRV